MIIRERKGYSLLILGILLVLLPTLLWAQEGRGRGRMRGTVKDTEGNPIAGARILADSTEFELKLETETDQAGRWSIMGMDYARWRFTASKEGYLPMYTNLQVSTVRRNPPIDFVLKKATASDILAGKAGLRELLIQAEQIFKEGKYVEALESYQKVLAGNPDLYQLHYNIGNCYMEQGEYEKAIAEYNLYLEQEPDTPSVLSKLGEIYVRKGDFDQGVVYFQKVIELNPEDPTTYYNIAEIYFDSGEVEKAIENYQKALQVNPDWSQGHLKLGYAYLNQGDNDNALLHFEKFLELEPDSPDAALIKELIARIKGGPDL